MNIAIYLVHKEVPYWTFSDRHLSLLQQGIPCAKIQVCSTHEDFLKAIKQARIALIWTFKQDWLILAPCLEWIVTPAAGRDYFQLNADCGLTIDYGSFHGEIIAETVIGMILCQTRGLRDCLELMRQSSWPRDILWKNMRNLRGSSVTILGFGSIGKWIARLLKPFGVKITGVKRTDEQKCDFFDDQDKIITIDRLDSVLPQTDHLVLALPSGAQTDNIIDKHRINLLPSHAVIYNIGRGNAIDEGSLTAALKNQTIQAAYLDVFKEEPIKPGSPLLDCPNLFIMPHASAIAPNYLDLFIDEFIFKYKKKYMN